MGLDKIECTSCDVTKTTASFDEECEERGFRCMACSWREVNERMQKGRREEDGKLSEKGEELGFERSVAKEEERFAESAKDDERCMHLEDCCVEKRKRKMVKREDELEERAKGQDRSLSGDHRRRRMSGWVDDSTSCTPPSIPNRLSSTEIVVKCEVQDSLRVPRPHQRGSALDVALFLPNVLLLSRQ